MKTLTIEHSYRTLDCEMRESLWKQERTPRGSEIPAPRAIRYARKPSKTKENTKRVWNARAQGHSLAQINLRQGKRTNRVWKFRVVVFLVFELFLIYVFGLSVAVLLFFMCVCVCCFIKDFGIVWIFKE